MEFPLRNWLGIGFLCGGVFVSSLSFSSSETATDSANWPRVLGEITETKIIAKPGRQRLRKTQPTFDYLPTVEFKYRVGNSQLLHRQIHFPELTPAQIVKKYPTGAQVVVTYDPDDVNDSFLEPPTMQTSDTLNGAGVLLLAVGSCILILPAFIRALGFAESSIEESDPAMEPRPLTAVCESRPTTIGDISAVIGRDVRELKLSGWSDRQIQELIDQKLAN